MLSTSSTVTRRGGVDGRGVADPDAVWLDPDPASASGLSVRVIGYSLSAHAVLSVVLLPAGVDPADRPHGEWWGANAWHSPMPVTVACTNRPNKEVHNEQG